MTRIYYQGILYEEQITYAFHTNQHFAFLDVKIINSNNQIHINGSHQNAERTIFSSESVQFKP